MTRGLVSIITPVYNGARFIRTTIDSILAQTYKEWELIVIDDGSKDDSYLVVDSYKKNDERIYLFAQPNGGSASARNNGIRRAQGQYICLLDADDWWEPTFLESQLKFMNEKQAHLVYGSHTRVDENGFELLRPFIAPSTVTYHDLLKTCSISCLTGVYNTEVYGKEFLNEEFGSIRDDYIYWLSIIKKVGVGYGNKAILSNCRVLKASATRKKSRMVMPQFKVLRKVEKLSMLSSLYYLASWALHGFAKYRK